MRLPNRRRSRRQRLLQAITRSPDGIKANLPDLTSASALKERLPDGRAVRAGLIATGVAGLTAGSAGISSLRRRSEGPTGDS